MRDLLRDAGNTISGWTNNSDIMSACCVKFSSVSMQHVHVYVATVRMLGVRSNSYIMHCKTVILIGNIPTYMCTVHCADSYKHTLGTERYNDS